MPTSSSDEAAPGQYRGLGLVSNPFKPRQPFTEESYPGVELVAHAAANRFLSTVDSAADTVPSQPIWVEKAGNLPLSYYVTPLAEVLGVLGDPESGFNVLAGYVPLDMMRLGRVRAILSVIAERVAGVRADLTIAAWMRRVLDEPDDGLPEYAPVAAADLKGLTEAFEADPSGTVERYFGPFVAMREGVEDLEMLMRVSTARQDALDIDPSEEVEAVAAEAPQDEFSEVFTQPKGPAPGAAAALSEEASRTPAATEPEDGLPAPDDLVAYLVAYTSAHLSPVVARALRAYRAQGYTSMTEELKITKAPTKTLAALVRFATCRYRKVVILFDRFEVWDSVPEDLRLKILGTFSQLRWALRDGAVLAVLSATGQTPELEELFAGATRVRWDMPGLVELEGMDPPFSLELAQGWLDAATLAGYAPISIDQEPLGGLVAARDGSLRRVAAVLAAAIDDAAARGVPHVDEAAAAAALSLVHRED